MIIRSSHSAAKAIRHGAFRSSTSSSTANPRLVHTISHRTPIAAKATPQHPKHNHNHTYPLRTSTRHARPYSTTPTTPSADALMTQLTDLYSTAKDEFEIAAEETEKKSVYAAEDRGAAHEALDALRAAYEDAVKGGGEVAREVERRVGPRIRELEGAVRNMDDLATVD